MMEAKDYMASIHPVSKEFIDDLQKAFPNKIPSMDATLAQVQRVAGQQEVIQWAMRAIRGRSINDPTHPALRDK
jgi:type IV secretory pathway TrbL component